MRRPRDVGIPALVGCLKPQGILGLDQRRADAHLPHGLTASHARHLLNQRRRGAMPLRLREPRVPALAARARADHRACGKGDLFEHLPRLRSGLGQLNNFFVREQ